jgi:hypothetical protein
MLSYHHHHHHHHHQQQQQQQHQQQKQQRHAWVLSLLLAAAALGGSHAQFLPFDCQGSGPAVAQTAAAAAQTSSSSSGSADPIFRGPHAIVAPAAYFINARSQYQHCKVQPQQQQQLGRRQMVCRQQQSAPMTQRFYLERSACELPQLALLPFLPSIHQLMHYSAWFTIQQNT